MAIRVVTSVTGPRGARPGGLQMVIAPVLVGMGSTQYVGVDNGPITASADPFFRRPYPFNSPREVTDSESYTPGAVIGRELKETIERQQAGERTSETLQRWWRRIRGEGEETGRNGGDADEPGGAGPVAEVRPQWLADP